MKKQIFTILLIIISQFTFAQDNELDKLFENQLNSNKEIINVLESSYSQSWNSVTEEYLTHHSRALYSYDDLANKTQILYENKDDEDNWIPYIKYNYLYTDDNVRSNGIRQNWDSDINEYVNKYQFLFYYNDEGLLIDVQTYNWNLESLEWSLHGNDMATYNDANELIERNIHTWDNELEVWNISSKITYEYEDGNKISRTRYFWNNTLENWDEWMMNEYTYTDDNLFSTTTSLWDTELEMWVLNSKNEYFYNDINLNDYRLNYYWSDDDEWVHTSRQLNNWMELSVGINSLSNTLFSIKPNPVSDYLYIDSTTDTLLNLSIYNSLGQLVLQNNTMQSSINVAALYKGVYFLKIVENNTNSLQLVQFIKD